MAELAQARDFGFGQERSIFSEEQRREVGISPYPITFLGAP
jgi:hypothetical protein